MSAASAPSQVLKRLQDDGTFDTLRQRIMDEMKSNNELMEFTSFMVDRSLKNKDLSMQKQRDVFVSLRDELEGPIFEKASRMAWSIVLNSESLGAQIKGVVQIAYDDAMENGFASEAYASVDEQPMAASISSLQPIAPDHPINPPESHSWQKVFPSPVPHPQPAIHHFPAIGNPGSVPDQRPQQNPQGLHSQGLWTNASLWPTRPQYPGQLQSTLTIPQQIPARHPYPSQMYNFHPPYPPHPTYPPYPFIMVPIQSQQPGASASASQTELHSVQSQPLIVRADQSALNGRNDSIRDARIMALPK